MFDNMNIDALMDKVSLSHKDEVVQQIAFHFSNELLGIVNNEAPAVTVVLGLMLTAGRLAHLNGISLIDAHEMLTFAYQESIKEQETPTHQELGKMMSSSKSKLSPQDKEKLVQELEKLLTALPITNGKNS